MAHSKRKIMALSAGASTLAIAGMVGIGTVSAASATHGTSLANRIATTFQLSTTDVQKVIDQNQADRQSKREQTYQIALAKAVTDGKLTATQEQAILTEHAKLEAELSAASGKGSHKATRATVRAEAKSWAKTNSIAASWLLGHRSLRG